MKSPRSTILTLFVFALSMSCSESAHEAVRDRDASVEPEGQTFNADNYDAFVGDDANAISNLQMVAEAKLAQSVRYPSPTLTDPIRIEITEGYTGEYPNADHVADPIIGVVKDVKMAKNPGRPGETNGGLKNYFRHDQDIEVIIKTPVLSKQIVIYGGRNIAVRSEVNGYVTKDRPKGMPAECDPQSSDFASCQSALKDKLFAYQPNFSVALAFDSPLNSVTVENIELNLNGDFTDGIGLRQNPLRMQSLPANVQKDFRGVDVFVRNAVIDGVGGHADGLHGDIVQLQSGKYRNLFFENFRGSTGYQGLYLPNRPAKSRLLAVSGSQDRYLSMEVTGTAYLLNVELRPYRCAHCVKPYLGLYTADPKEGEVYYPVILHNVTFFRDPLKRRAVNEYIVPQPAFSTPEGEIDMTIETRIDKSKGAASESIVRGKLRVQTEAGCFAN
jgi:hypothetical protein